MHYLCALSLKGLKNLLDRIERMRALGPEFVDITWYVSAYHCSNQILKMSIIGTLADEPQTSHPNWSRHVRD